ncbi:hypothetical protein IE81DRAFT_331312 [Ceraceosorus guamensis]|uniref:Uncharacterized protein n=1 Tax=Ceraceosorus guamensis TaxID=1522189 RepID=A0A316VTH7_9BASI|nr:hypothetical protein IE81DRAFT_331312 [Ceraceosorus guamensis]PWN40887.1 hypothetical protein IE81DRAFT_331312 [Ceraceosorus guamensis]
MSTDFALATQSTADAEAKAAHFQEEAAFQHRRALVAESALDAKEHQLECMRNELESQKSCFTKKLRRAEQVDARNSSKSNERNIELEHELSASRKAAFQHGRALVAESALNAKEQELERMRNKLESQKSCFTKKLRRAKRVDARNSSKSNERNIELEHELSPSRAQYSAVYHGLRGLIDSYPAPNDKHNAHLGGDGRRNSRIDA